MKIFEISKNRGQGLGFERHSKTQKPPPKFVVKLIGEDDYFEEQFYDD